MTDDAYIAFRYVSNSILGYGYVWNAPPFRPVEGYSSFLWVVILDAVWRVTGVEPPAAANWLSLGFSFLTLAIVICMVLLMNWNEQLKKYRLLSLSLVLLGIFTNRTFLAWTSSGLETAMFNFFVMLWLLSAIYLERGTRWWIFLTTASALLIYLTRPDGILFAFTTLLMLAIVIWEKRAHVQRLDYLFALPILGLPLHMLWRKCFYGVWLPNTYYAKVIQGRSGWESGHRYFLSFVIEYSLWIWLVLCLIWCIYSLRNNPYIRNLNYYFAIQALSVLTLLGQFLYYTIIVGGDYFEFRIYSHLVPILFISFVWMLDKLNLRPKMAFICFVIFLGFSLPIQWMGWLTTNSISLRDEIRVAPPSLADYVNRKLPFTPGPILHYLAYYDEMQSWLDDHYVCLRHYKHRVFSDFMLNYMITREEGLSISGNNFPVAKQIAVGVISWVLPHINIIDEAGLNDYVIARNPELRPREHMAHDRKPPIGYVECFDVNVNIRYHKIVIVQRDTPLTASDIQACETNFAAIVEKMNDN